MQIDGDVLIGYTDWERRKWHDWLGQHREALKTSTRIISARAAASHERRAYEETHKEQRREIRAIAAKRDSDIDFSDAPPVLDWSGAEIGKFYRPKKKPVTMRLDSDVIAWLKADGRGYQTKANWLLRNAMLHFTKEADISRRKGTPRHGKAREGKGKG